MKADDDKNNCVSTGKERGDRQVQTKNRFEALHLDVKCPDTAILLLGSQERPVLVAAAAALTKFAAKGKENLQTLFELDIVDSLNPLIDHEDLLTRRFAARLFAEIAAIPFVRNYLLEKEFYLARFIKILTKDSDTFMQEYASRILAEISKDPYGSAKLLEHCPDLGFLIENLKILDPDVKKNNIEIIDNLLKDLTGADQIVGSQSFSFLPICQLFEEPYPEIQSLALSVVESLVARSMNDRICQFFEESGTFQALLNLLLADNVDSSSADLRSDILRVLTRAIEKPIILETLNDTSGEKVAKLFRYFETRTNTRESRDILDVLVHVAKTAPGRETLHRLGIVKHLIQILRGSSRDNRHEINIKIAACYGIGMMSRYELAAKEIAQENIINMVFDILKLEENSKCLHREAATFALRELCISDRKNCEIFLDIKGPMYLESLLKQPIGKVSPDMAILAVDILNFVGGYPDWRELVIDGELIDALCASFEGKDGATDKLKIASCRALASFSVEKRAREMILIGNVVKKLFDLLQDNESTLVRGAAVQLVQQLSADPEIAEQFIQAGYLNYMLKNRAVSTVVPTWNTCIDALFSAHLPVKFAATGRLSLHEITHDGFYVMRRHICPFPILDELLHLKMCPMEPVYVINFADPRSNVSEDNKSSSPSTAAEAATRRLSINSTNAWMEVKFGKLQIDPYLYEYLELFRCILAANELADTTADESRRKIVDISKIASRAKLLGKFVARQMSGPNPQNPCIDHQLDIHVREIREDIETSVIPLGQLRVGFYLERALLFKVMADKICLPATLVRGEYGKAWNEIAIPQIENPVDYVYASHVSKTDSIDPPRSFKASKKSLLVMQEKIMTKNSLIDTADIQQEKSASKTTELIRDSVKTVLPTSMLQENYIIDLMDNPGDLIPIKSSRARTYCSPISSHCENICDI